MTDGAPPPSDQPPPPPGGGTPPPPPPQQPLPGAAPPSPAKSSGCLKWIIAAVVLVAVAAVGVVGCVAFVGTNLSDEIERQVGEADEGDYDVSLDDCEASFGFPQASGTITNTSGEEQGFQVEVRFETGGGTLIGEGATFTDSIRTGQRAQWSTSPLESIEEGTTVTCEVVRVSYTIFD